MMRATVAIGRAGGGARGSVLLSSMLLFLVPSLATAMALAAGLGSYMALPTSVAETLASRGYQSATPIQAVALTRVYSGESLMLHAETGSGKTLAMLLPALCRTAPETIHDTMTRSLCGWSPNPLPSPSRAHVSC